MNMKTYLLVTAALLVAISGPAMAAEPGPTDGAWAVGGAENCKVPNKVYYVTVQSQYLPTRFRFDNVATGSYDIEEFVAMGDGSLLTETIQSVRANGSPGHAIGTEWRYSNVTSVLINVESTDKRHSYWIVKCDQ
jgi:hypothetical protein